jgi:hypothetical protein
MPRIKFKPIELPAFVSNEASVTAWGAGVLDGEGSVGCSFSGGKQRKVPHVCCQVMIGQAKKGLPLLKALEQLFGGSVSESVKPVHTWSAYYVWGLYGRNAVPFLKRVEQYLVLKREQAKCVIELEGRRALDGPRNKPRSPEFMRTKDGQGKWSSEPRPMTTGRCIGRAFVAKMMDAGKPK